MRGFGIIGEVPQDASLEQLERPRAVAALEQLLQLLRQRRQRAAVACRDRLAQLPQRAQKIALYVLG